MNRTLLGGAVVVVLGAGIFGLSQIQNARTVKTSSTVQATRKQTNSKISRNYIDEDALHLTGMYGKRISVDPNKKTVLHFMASSCASCLPTETMLATFEHTPNVRMISIDVDPFSDNVGTIARFSQEAGSSWPYVMDKKSKLIDKFHITSLDTVIVLYHNKVIYRGIVPSKSKIKQVLA